MRINKISIISEIRGSILMFGFGLSRIGDKNKKINNAECSGFSLKEDERELKI
jgi:hypothetical protein